MLELETDARCRPEPGALSIAHLSASLSEKGSGVKAVVEQMSAQSDAMGHRVRVIGFDEPGSDNWRGGPAVRVPLRGPSIFGYAPAMGKVLDDFKPQIVHVHGLWLLFGTEALRYKRNTGAPFVINPHGMLASPALQIKPWRKRIARLLYQDRLLTQADCLVATSENELEHIRSAGFGGPVAIIPLGIESAASVTGFSDKGEKRVLYMGRKLPLKGLEDLALAWKELAPRFPDWRLHIIGPDSGGFEMILAALINANNIPQIDLLPPVYGPSRDQAYRECQVTILPSQSENFALTVGESLVRGIPAIATRATPWKGLEDHRCGLWIEGGRQSIRAALARMMSLTAMERYTMGQRGRTWILRDFQWPELARQHHRLYSWLLGTEGRPEFVVT